MEIKVEWEILEDTDSSWESCRCLYAYLAPKGKEILYIGKAWGTSVRNRWSRNGKEEFWEDLEKQRGIKYHIPLIGKIYLQVGRRLTGELLADVESLLINIEKPWGNIQSQKNRIGRPGMRVTCNGTWPGQGLYIDK